MDFDLTGASIFATNQSRNGEMSIDMEPEGGGLGGVGALGRGRESGGRHEDQVTSRVNRFQKQAVATRPEGEHQGREAARTGRGWGGG